MPVCILKKKKSFNSEAELGDHYNQTRRENVRERLFKTERECLIFNLVTNMNNGCRFTFLFQQVSQL